MGGRHTPDYLVRQFLARNTGCGFASALAKSTDGIIWAVIDGAPTAAHVESTNGLFVGAAKESKVAAAVFPALRTTEDVARLIQVFSSDPSWQLKRRDWKHHRRSDLLISLRWITASKVPSSVMGLAPIGSMPVHRRAPFVALIVWPGGRDNPNNTLTPAATLGFLDIKLSESLLKQPGYENLYTTTEEDVAQMKTLPPEGAARHDVTFCLHPEADSVLGESSGTRKVDAGVADAVGPRDDAQTGSKR
jgi:hypothetical protein